MAINLRKLPEDFIMKFELGLETSFKFKDINDSHYKVIMKEGTLLTLVKDKMYDNWNEVANCRTVEAINAFISSRRFVHWHVDIGSMHKNRIRL